MSEWINKGDFALMWANGASFREIYDLMEAQIRLQVAAERAAADELIRNDQALGLYESAPFHLDGGAN